MPILPLRDFPLVYMGMYTRGTVHSGSVPNPSELSVAARERWQRYMSEFGINLQRARHQLGYSQEYVAAQTGISPYTYMRYEQGLGQNNEPANPKLTNLLALSYALQTPLHALLPSDPPDLR